MKQALTTSATSELYDPATGTWQGAGTTALAIRAHNATLLPSGKVLLTGGLVAPGGTYTSTAWLYNPADNSWDKTNPPGISRANHGAVLLPGGQILIAGGQTAINNPTASVELYDVSRQGGWKLLTNAPALKTSLSSTKLQDGRVLVLGTDNNDKPAATIYNPQNNSWAIVGAPVANQYFHSTTLLPNGQVLIAGGAFTTTSVATATVQLFDPATNTFTFTGSLNQARSNHLATLLPDGQVLVTGGSSHAAATTDNSAVTLSSVEIYNPNSGFWTTGPAMTTSRLGHSAVLLSNGKVLVAGGLNKTLNQTGVVNSAELYDPTINSWLPTSSLNKARYFHTTTLLNNGKVLVVGGVNSTNNGTLGSVEIYDPVTQVWSPRASLHYERYYHQAALLNDGRVLVVNGSVSSPFLYRNQTEIYDPTTDSWITTDSSNAERAWLTPYNMVKLDNGKIFIQNNFEVGFYPELFDINQTNWRNTGYMVGSRYQHTATLLPDGRVLATGGLAYTTATTSTAVITNSTEIYNPTTGLWTKTAAMSDTRTAHSATLLPNGQVLVIGGSVGSAEIYNPQTNSWQLTASPNFRYISNTATLLPDGRVFVTGYGSDVVSPFDNSNKTLIYNPVANSWQPVTTPALGDSLPGHSATLLLNGKILVISKSTTTWLYDPQTNSWTPAANTIKNRPNHSAILLTDGRVLIVGGVYEEKAEIYDPLTNSWQLTDNWEISSYSEKHVINAATLLSDGRVLVTGDKDSYDSSFDPFHAYMTAAKIYNPATNKWTSVGRTFGYRQNHQATLLSNGQVLISGGYKDGNYADPPTELFDLGLEYSPATQPEISTATLANGLLNLTGSGFKGISEGATGSFYSSAINYPLVQVRRLDNGQVKWSMPLNSTSTTYSGQGLSGIPDGFALITVFANGIPSKSKLVALTGGNTEPCTQPLVVTSGLDDGTAIQCGTLSYAITYANSLPLSDTGRIVTFDLSVTEVKFTGGSLPALNPGLTINGGSCASGLPIKINGNGLSAPPGGLRTQGGVTLKNLWIFGFSGRQLHLSATSETTRPECLRVSRN